MRRPIKIILSTFCVLVLLIAVSLVGVFNEDEKENKEKEAVLDSDGDGMPNEWELLYGLDPEDPSDAVLDPDDDGLNNLEEHGTRTVPTDPDTDDDSTKDGDDVDPLIDSVVVIQFTHYAMEDAGEPGSGEVDVYFKISLNEVELTSEIIKYDTDEGNISLDHSVFYNMPDDVRLVDITFSWYDSDVFFDDKLDCSEFGDSCDIIYSIENHSWWGDTSIGTTSGNFDGSTNETNYFDENDVTINFTIFDSVGHADEIAAILENAGSSEGFEDCNEMVRFLGHNVLEEVVEWCLDNPRFFELLGPYGELLALGLGVLGILIYVYEIYFLPNKDGP